jgi:tRNA dimethylallyltransferase
MVSKASKIITELHERGKIPILVGGTHYYIQSLLFPDRVLAEKQDFITAEEQEAQWPILKASSEEMYAELQRVDPVMATKWHPKDTRKVRRSLEIWLETGKRASDVYAQQRQTTDPELEGSNSKTSLGRLQDEEATNITGSIQLDPLIFWTYAESAALEDRLNARVDTMIQTGLLSEIESMQAFHDEQAKNGILLDKKRGIWVAIGFKEFEDYLSAAAANASESDVEKELKMGIELTKIATRQYAKSQIRWIRIKLYRELRDRGMTGQFFLLDSTDLLNWTANVQDQAVEITQQFLQDKPVPDPLSLSKTAKTVLLNARERPAASAFESKECEACNIVLTTDNDWQKHTKSARHKGMLKRLRNPERVKRREAAGDRSNGPVFLEDDLDFTPLAKFV